MAAHECAGHPVSGRLVTAIPPQPCLRLTAAHLMHRKRRCGSGCGRGRPAAGTPRSRRCTPPPCAWTRPLAATSRCRCGPSGFRSHLEASATRRPAPPPHPTVDVAASGSGPPVSGYQAPPPHPTVDVAASGSGPTVSGYQALSCQWPCAAPGVLPKITAVDTVQCTSDECIISCWAGPQVSHRVPIYRSTEMHAPLLNALRPLLCCIM